MPAFEIDGGLPLRGVVEISGAKNAALPLMAAGLLTRERLRLHRVPHASDIDTMVKVLRDLGVNAEWSGNNTLDLRVTDESPCTAPREYTLAMRASICVLGPLLARRCVAHITPPGGCKIGERPIDAHIKGLKALGARVVESSETITASARRLTGAEIDLSVPSGSTVLGTANVMSAATLAKGRTIIQNAACEPEVCQLAELLNAMGAQITGIGSKQIVVDGVRELHGAEIELIPDRIEAGTFMVAAAITGGNVLMRNVRRAHMDAVFQALLHMGVDLSEESSGWRVRGQTRFRPADIVTAPFPGYPTDMQAQIMALMCVADGISAVQDTIYPDRFHHVAELRRMGARIKRGSNRAWITGVERLTGAHVTASDLRASAALVLAGLVAHGRTTIAEVQHIDRGYERIVEKLSGLGAKIRRVG
jgi:UDP-N-acetylglucosamine 1-carboxyvinyltransferase